MLWAFHFGVWQGLPSMICKNCASEEMEFQTRGCYTNYIYSSQYKWLTFHAQRIFIPCYGALIIAFLHKI